MSKEYLFVTKENIQSSDNLLYYLDPVSYNYKIPLLIPNSLTDKFNIYYVYDNGEKITQPTSLYVTENYKNKSEDNFQVLFINKFIKYDDRDKIAKSLYKGGDKYIETSFELTITNSTLFYETYIKTSKSLRDITDFLNSFVINIHNENIKIAKEEHDYERDYYKSRLREDIELDIKERNGKYVPIGMDIVGSLDSIISNIEADGRALMLEEAEDKILYKKKLGLLEKSDNLDLVHEKVDTLMGNRKSINKSVDKISDNTDNIYNFIVNQRVDLFKKLNAQNIDLTYTNIIKESAKLGKNSYIMLALTLKQNVEYIAKENNEDCFVDVNEHTKVFSYKKYFRKLTDDNNLVNKLYSMKEELEVFSHQTPDNIKILNEKYKTEQEKFERVVLIYKTFLETNLIDERIG